MPLIMQRFIDYILKNKEWIFSGIGVLIFSAIVLLMKRMLNWIPSRAELKERKSKRREYMNKILEEIRDERSHFERIKNGKHIGLTGTKRKATLEYSFDDIRGELLKLKDERRYRKMISTMLPIIDGRNVNDPRDEIVKLEPMLDTLEEKLRKEIEP
jgi:hypothetical protein